MFVHTYMYYRTYNNVSRVHEYRGKHTYTCTCIHNGGKKTKQKILNKYLYKHMGGYLYLYSCVEIRQGMYFYQEFLFPILIAKLNHNYLKNNF